jgi:hypothetical protein
MKILTFSHFHKPSTFSTSIKYKYLKILSTQNVKNSRKLPANSLMSKTLERLTIVYKVYLESIIFFVFPTQYLTSRQFYQSLNS